VTQSKAQPLESHWTTVKRILQYLKGTLLHVLHLTPMISASPFPLQAFCNLDWATNTDDQMSTSSVVIFLGQNFISWWSNKQSVVARSTTKGKYLILSQTMLKLNGF